MFQRRVEEIVQRAGYSRSTDQNVRDAAVYHPDAIDGNSHLFRVGNIAPNAQRIAAVLLNFNVSQIEFRFAARNQREPRSQTRKPDGHSLPDTAAAARYQNALMLKSVCRDESNPFPPSPA
jgi:hypothetical protein